MKKTELKIKFYRAEVEESTGYSFQSFWHALKIQQQLTKRLQRRSVTRLLSELAIPNDWVSQKTQKEKIDFISNYIENIICDCVNHMHKKGFNVINEI